MGNLTLDWFFTTTMRTRPIERSSLSPAMVAARSTKINPTDQTHLSEAETFNFEPSHDPSAALLSGVRSSRNRLCQFSIHFVLSQRALQTGTSRSFLSRRFGQMRRKPCTCSYAQGKCLYDIRKKKSGVDPLLPVFCMLCILPFYLSCWDVI